MLKRTLFFVILFLLLSSYIVNASALNSPIKAIDGTLTLDDNWHEDIIELNGEWEFYWMEILASSDFTNPKTSMDKTLITLPRAWNKFDNNGENLSGDGFATFRLVVNNIGDRVVGIMFPRIFTAYNCYINGELVATAGKVGNSSSTMVPQYLPQTKYYQTDLESIEIIIQVSNFKHRSGGVLGSIKIGPADKINKMQNVNLAFELFMFGGLFIIGIYHLLLYLFRTKEINILFFSVYSLLISFRTLLVGEIFFIKMFPGFNWEIEHKIQTLCFYLGVFFIVSFLRSTFPEDSSKRFVNYVKIVSFSFSSFVLLTPAKIFTLINPVYQLFTVTVIIYIFWLVIVSCKRKREGSYLLGFGMIVLSIFVLNDILFLSTFFADNDNPLLRNFISKGNLSSLGLLILTFTQALVLAKKLVKSFYNEEQLTHELSVVNESLEYKIKERTLTLEQSKEELLRAYQAVSRTEKSLENLIQNISHDLRSPLTSIKGYVNIILDEIAYDPAQQKKFLYRVKEKVNSLNYMVQELLDLAQLQSRKLVLNLEETSLESFIKTYSEKYQMDMKSASINFSVKYATDWKERSKNKYIKFDHDKIERVFSNLFSNSIKFTPVNGAIVLGFDFSENNDYILIKVTDSGTGIKSEDLQYIFDRFYMASKSRANSSGSGLGLAISKEIVECHNGVIWAESELDKGCSITFSLPIY